MKPLVLITFIVVCCLGTIQADVPDIHPDIYAICHVETKEGTEFEGVLLMAKGIALDWKPSGPPAYKGGPSTIGTELYLHTNGFYVSYGDCPHCVHGIPFSAELRKLEINKNGRIIFSGTSEPVINLMKGGKLFFLRDISPQIKWGTTTVWNEQDNKADSTKDSKKGKTILKRHIQHAITYEMLDYLPLWLEAPVPKISKESEEPCSEKLPEPDKKIPLHKIIRFELVLNPSTGWPDRIKRWKNERAKWRKQMWELECIDWVSVWPQPVWFHDLVKNNELYKTPFRPWLH
jgi:hypothetical protein